jgi:UTP:GlnB (protein PII) uridylyltransferase
MDPRGRETEALAAAGGLTRLSAATGAEFPALVAARERTERKLEERRRALGDVERDEDLAVVLMGSWGRLEVTGGSDNDFMCLVDGHPRTGTRPSVKQAWEKMGSHGKRPAMSQEGGSGGLPAGPRQGLPPAALPA